MQIAIICPFLTPSTIAYAEGVAELLLEHQMDVIVETKLRDAFQNNHSKTSTRSFVQLLPETDFLFCIGGDGSMLQAVQCVRDSNVPILGINTGRLGFLTSLQKESLKEGLKRLKSNTYSLVNRTLLTLEIDQYQDQLQGFPYALNEISVSRKDTASLVSISVEINRQPLTTYWADGLMVTTPTGSTGYNLSSGGPVVLPGTPSFVMTPIAPHNLNIRPMVLPDDATIRLQVGGREEQHLLSLDAGLISLPMHTSITISKANFCVRTVQLNDTAFFEALREKLFWGVDKRN